MNTAPCLIRLYWRVTVEDILRADNYRLAWCDSRQSILQMDVLSAWTWDDAYSAIGKMNEVVATVSHDVYSILHFHNRHLTIPRSGLSIPNIKVLLSKDHPNERLIILVNSNPMIEMLMRTASKIYFLNTAFAKYRFVPSLDQAFEQINQYRTAEN